MRRVLIIILLLFSSFISYAEDDSEIKDKKYELTIRFGQGGFSDSRSPLGKLGGGQSTFDFKLKKYPWAISTSGEYYTNSSDATHSYEISALQSLNILYIKSFEKYERLTLFSGGGLAIIEVPRDDNPDNRETTYGYNAEIGINYRVYKIIGLYAVAKYLYAQKEEDNIKVINFDEFIGLIGFTLNFEF